MIAWHVQCIATRADILGFAAAADLLYIMMYDTRSQIFDQCIAGPNAGLPIVQLGVQQCEHRHLSLSLSRARGACVLRRCGLPHRLGLGRASRAVDPWGAMVRAPDPASLIEPQK